MERLAGINAHLAGDNVRLQTENATLLARVGEVEGQIGALTEKVVTLTKLVFGTSSEKSKPIEPRRGNDDAADEKRPRVRKISKLCVIVCSRCRECNASSGCNWISECSKTRNNTGCNWGKD